MIFRKNGFYSDINLMQGQNLQRELIPAKIANMGFDPFEF
jgi:hypothetical protein